MADASDGFELVDNNEVGGIGRDDIAGINESQANLSVDWRLDIAPIQLQLGGFNGGIVRLDGALVLA